MKTLLWSGFAFLVGINVGAKVACRAFELGLRDASLDQVAERAVNDVASAYEQQLDKNHSFQRFREKLDDCLTENARLKRRRFTP